MNYENGLLLALLTWLWGLIAIVINVNSLFEKNLNKVGQRLSWLTYAPKAMDSKDKDRPLWRSVGKFLLIAAIGLPFAFLSWLQVLLFIGMTLYRWNKDSGAPQSVKEFRWKMRNVDMSFDDIVKEMLKLQGRDMSEFATTRASIV